MFPSFVTTRILILSILQVFFGAFASQAMDSEGDSICNSCISFGKFEATVSSKIIHFQWSVDSEVNGDRFVIEKSLDEETWDKVTEVQSIRNHKEQHTYQISEINFAEGAQEYFRVVRVDQSGEKTELDRVNINQPILTNMLLIPVPRKVNKEMTVSYDSMICSDGTFRVIDATGFAVEESTLEIATGYNRLLLNIRDYEPGKYIVVIKDEFGNKMTRDFTVY